MSGGSWEYVMGNYNDTIGSSGFESMPESKYYNKYTSSDIYTACNGSECLSHGLSETTGWYDDQKVAANAAWIYRSGASNDGKSSGIFHYRNTSGSIYNGYNFDGSFRLVLTPALQLSK